MFAKRKDLEKLAIKLLKRSKIRIGDCEKFGSVSVRVTLTPNSLDKGILIFSWLGNNDASEFGISVDHKALNHLRINKYRELYWLKEKGSKIDLES